MRGQVVALRVLAAALLVAAAGCAGGKKTAPVRGAVTLDGKPVSLVSVVFLPQREGGMMAQGVTNKDGDFELTTYKPNDGALPGEYRVVVTKIDEVPPADLRDLPAEMSAEEIMKKVVPRVMAKMAQHKKVNKPMPFPKIYGDAKRSPLKCSVPVDGKVTLPLDSKMQ
jgi:hypothetical protein